MTKTVERHARIEDPEVFQVALEAGTVAESAVECRTAVRAHERREVVKETVVGNPVPPQPEEPAEPAIGAARSPGGHGMAQDADVGLAAPAPPEHAQVAVVQFVGQEAKHLLGMEIMEVNAVGIGRVGPDEERQEVLHDLGGQVRNVLLVGGSEAGTGIRPQFGQPAAAETDMSAIVGQADVRVAGQHDQVPRDDAALRQLGDGIEVAAAEDLVAQAHVLVLGLATVPS
jgi:hypothetical protein